MSVVRSEDGSFSAHTRKDGRMPVALAIYTTRQDPELPSVQNIKVTLEFAFAMNQDEASGIGLRMAEESSPSSDGWRPPSIAIRWIVKSEAEEIARAVNNNLVNPPT